MNITRRDFLKISFALAFSLTFPKNLFARSIRIPIFLYHDISHQFKDDYTISPANFASQMEWLYAHGYKAVSIRDLQKYFNCGDEKIVLLTFDDGYASFMDYAFPLLREYDFRATINIIGKYVGTYIKIYGNRPMLSWDEYRYLIGSNFVDLGCHTYNMHVWRDGKGITAFSEKERENDLLLFQDIFQKETGRTTDILAWPYGIFDNESIEIAKQAGFQYIFTSNEGFLTDINNFQEIPRKNISNRINISTLKSYIGERI